MSRRRRSCAAGGWRRRRRTGRPSGTYSEMRTYPSIQRGTAMFSRRSQGPAGPDLALLVALTATILASAVPSEAQDRTTPGETVSYSTIHSIGIEWGISGDANHNATVTVHYRAQGTGPWKAALPLVRVDNTYNGNGFAGSILFLDPDTTYKVRLDLSDPDGGRDGRRMLTVATRPLPTLPTGGRRFHVVPGSGGGNGSRKKPFQGIAAPRPLLGRGTPSSS